MAVAQNQAIGFKNQLLWHIPEDFRYFKSITSGHTVIMGKNTFYSLPKGPLPNRRNIVISDILNDKIEGCEMAYSLDEAIAMADDNKENFIIGGASIYRQFFSKVQKLYITWVFKDFEADTFFPEVKNEDWELISEKPQSDSHIDGLHYKFNIYQRRK